MNRDVRVGGWEQDTKGAGAGIRQGIKDGERVLQTPGQLAAVMNIRAAA